MQPRANRCEHNVRDYIVAPSTHGANSALPKSKLSLLVGWPDAVFSINSKMRWPHCCTISSPSRMVPQLTSMSSSMRLYSGPTAGYEKRLVSQIGAPLALHFRLEQERKDLTRGGWRRHKKQI